MLSGIDNTFDNYDQRQSKTRKINGLGFCSQEVLGAAEDMKEAAVGVSEGKPEKPAAFQITEIASYLRRNAQQMQSAKVPKNSAISSEVLVRETSVTLNQLATDLEKSGTLPRMEDLERRLTVLEEKLFAALLASTPDDEIVSVRAQADRELAPYRRKMPAAQIDQLQKQYVQKRLLEKYGLPRLSLFYM